MSVKRKRLMKVMFDNNEDNHPGLSGMHKDTHIIPKENVIIYTVHLSVQTSQKYK